MASYSRSTHRATREATEALAARSQLGEFWWRRLYPSGPVVARFGFGTYRLEDRRVHMAALQHALTSGRINLLDTAANYELGASEELIGRALSECFTAGVCRREELVVISKVGHFKGEMLDALERSAGSLPGDAVVRVSDTHAYSLHPDVISRVFEQSRERLGLEVIDGFLLHDPGYLLEPGPVTLKGRDRAARYDHLLGVLERAFGRLEQFVAEGKLSFYGISADGLRAGTEPSLQICLEDVLEAARRAGGPRHHFRLAQFPFNPLESEACDSEGEGSLVERCRSGGIASVGNRPLNAHRGGFIVRLASPGDETMATRFAEVRLALERHEACCPMGSWPRDLPRWSHQLPKAMRGLVSTLAFDDFRARFASPTTETALATSGLGALGEWSEGYRERLSLLMDCARAQFVTRDRRNLGAIFEQIDGYGCEGPSGFSLAQRALAWQLTRRCAPTVSLVGMRRPSYVDEVLALAEHPFAVDGGGLRKGET